MSKILGLFRKKQDEKKENSLSYFITKASKKEQEKVIKDIAHRVNKEQKMVVEGRG